MNCLTFESDIKKLPASLYTQICQQLNVDDEWKRLLEYIPHRKRSGPRFGIDDENSFALQKDPANALLTAWSSDYVTISNLVETLRQAEFLRQAQRIEDNVRPPGGGTIGSTSPDHVSVAMRELETPLDRPPVPVFKYEALRRYTNNFNRNMLNMGGNLIGFGGSADVFKGFHAEMGRDIAVKKIKTGDQISSNKQFKNELEVLSSLGTHRNLLQFYGISADGPALCIVYEFMAGGSLHDRLQTESVAEILTVDQRLTIAEDAAEGLIYLHSKKLIHRDVKSSNILLGDYDEAKIADYGITRGGPNNGVETETQLIIGTKPYMPIEYCKDGIVSYAMDSYAYGIVLLELLTSLVAYDIERDERCLDGYVMEVGIHRLLDHRAGEWKKKCVDAVYDTTLRLLAKHSLRPTMSDVLIEVQKWK